ncbi:MAG TPA: hypothetical protein VE085_06135 [Burkholderiales bacterium]|nr:hypothetical protein [Burkholderiales bacterium]
MRRIALSAALALAASAWAQQPAPTTRAPAATPPAQEAPKAQVAKSEAKTPARKPNPHRQEDARHCLDKPSNTEVIKCAEAYL